MTLFAIDVDAELARLCRDRYPSSWQLPGELVRIAHRRGVARLQLEIHRTRLLLACEEPMFSLQELGALRATLDPRLESLARHEALVSLEEQGLTAVAACFHQARGPSVLASGGREVTILERLVHGYGLRSEAATSATGGTRLVLEGLQWEHRRAKAWLETACRFAGPAVTLAGRAIPRGFDDVIAQTASLEPLPVRIAVRSRGEAPSLWLLWDGVLATRGTLVGLPAFGAAIEMSGLAPGPENGAVLRGALAPHVPAIVDAAVDLMLATAVDPSRARHHSGRLARLLLEAMRAGARTEAIASAPILLRLTGRARAERTSVARLRETRDGHAVTILEDVDQSATHVVPAAGALVLDAASRAVLSEILGVPLVAAQRRAGPSIRGRIARILLGAERLRASISGSSGSVLDDAALGAHERLALERIAPLLDPWDRSPAFSSGSATPGRVRGGRLLLPKGSGRVADLTSAVSRDPALAYVGALALLQGRGTPEQDPRARWLASLGVAAPASRTGGP